MTVKTIKVKHGQAKFRAQLKQELAKQGAHAINLAKRITAQQNTVWNPTELDAIGLELRHIAFRIRTLQQAKIATEEI